MAAVAKVVWMSSQSAAGPMVGGLVFPFLLKLSFSMTLVRKTYCDLVHASRFFFFQLSHIAFNNDTIYHHHHHHHRHVNYGGRNNNNTIMNFNSRFERALRLVYERLTHFRRSQYSQPPMASQDQEDSLHTLSMLAL